jgi:hypothetical protein
MLLINSMTLKIQDELKLRFELNEATGTFIRKFLPGRGRNGGRKAGTIAGWVRKDGYRIVPIQGRPYRNSHLVWLWYNGTLPDSNLEVDHIDRNPRNDNITNLRLATRSQNSGNTSSKNPTGYKGVYRLKTPYDLSRPYVARITKNGKRHRLGYFQTPKEAGEAYHRAAINLQGPFACTSSFTQ